MDVSAVAQRGDGPGASVASSGSRSLATRDVARRTGRAAMALITFQLAFRAWGVLQGFYYEDDFRYVYDAASSQLSADYLLQDYNGHLMPAQFLLVWLLQDLAPMSFGLVAGVLLAFQAAASWTVWLLVRELVGARPGALLPLAVYLLSPLTLGSFLWYAASIQAVPLQVVMAGTLLLHVRYLRTRRPAYALASLASFVAGLLFWEKALLVLPVVAGVTVLWFGRGGLGRRLFGALGTHWRLWLGYLVLSGAYLWLYASSVAWQLDSRKEAARTGELAREAVLNGFVPQMFGGPYTSFPTGLGLSPDPPLSLQLVFAQALLLVVVGTVVVRPIAWRAWALLAAYVGVDVLLLASGRLDVLGPIIGRDTRYLADASVVAAAAVALAVFPVAGSEGAPAPSRRDARLGQLMDRPVVLGLALLVYANSCLITSVEMVQRWGDTSAETYVRTAQADLRRLGDVVVYDSAPPKDVLSEWFLEDFRVSRIIGPLPEEPRFDEVTHDLYVVQSDGHLRAAELAGAAQSPAGPDGDCGWAVGSTARTVPMSQEMFAWTWVIGIDYFTGRATRATVDVGDEQFTVRFREGLHRLFIPHTGETGDVRISGVDPTATVCVTNVVVGQVARPDGA